MPCCITVYLTFGLLESLARCRAARFVVTIVIKLIFKTEQKSLLLWHLFKCHNKYTQYTLADFGCLKKQKQMLIQYQNSAFSSKTTACNQLVSGGNGLSGPKRICTIMLWTVSFSCSWIFVHNSTRNGRGGGALSALSAPWGEVIVEEKQVVTLGLSPIPSPANLHKQVTRHEPLTTMTTAPSCCRRKSRV